MSPYRLKPRRSRTRERSEKATQKRLQRKSQQSWQEFGDREVPNGAITISFRLNDYERINERASAAVAQLDELLPGLR